MNEHAAPARQSATPERARVHNVWLHDGNEVLRGPAQPETWLATVLDVGRADRPLVRERRTSGVIRRQRFRSRR